MSKCYKCGAELSGGGKFCSECGASQDKASPLLGDRMSGISLSGKSLGFSLDILSGETLFNNRFTIDTRIGSGGFGEVYLAMDEHANHPVALKIVPPVDGEELIAAEQLRNEINLRRRINDFSYIIRVNDIYVDSNYKGLPLVLLSMEYADGGSLREWTKKSIGFVRQDDKRIEEALSYFRDACLGVKAIHDAGLIHLDLKPENLLVMDNTIKVSDLGLSRNYIQYAQNREVILKELGTPTYMSPEQFKSARQKDINHLSDIYTLGIILFELLDGHAPFDGTYDELKNKHLTFKPPSLYGALSPWGKIVDRCLSKNPSKRYPNIDDLISDLKRAETGDVLSIDVACECGHINDNETLKKCEKCNQDISHLFRRCPNCQRLNRLDVEICPTENLGCGYEVGRHFRIESLLRKAHELKDIDPLEAIGHLVKVLNLDRGNREAKEMLPGVREIQEQIEDIIPEAEKAQKEGRLEDARGKWQDILSLATRHLLASEKKKGLDELIEKYNRGYDWGFILMEQGEFAEARKLLNSCREMIPTRKETDIAFKELNEREQNYDRYLEEAKTDKRLKNLASASKKLELCLGQASKSKEVLSLKSDVDNDIESSEKLYHDAEHFLMEAKFEEVKGVVDGIINIRIDYELLDPLVNDLIRKEEKYERAAKEWEKALETGIRDLKLAENALKKALKVCPDAKNADSLLKEVLKDKKSVKKLIKEAEPKIASAKFKEAAKKLEGATGIWRKAPNLNETKEKLKKIQDTYNKHIDKSYNDYEKEKDLSTAVKEVEAAIRTCPDSLEAKSLERKITNRQNEAKDLLEKAKSSIPKADFSSAKKSIQKAESIWVNLPGLPKIRNELNKKSEAYNESFSKAVTFYETKDLDPAMKCVAKSLNICSESKGAKALFNNVENDQRIAARHIQKIPYLISSAEFEKAESSIKETEIVWPNAPELKSNREKIESVKRKYKAFYDKAKQLFDLKNNLHEALRNANFACQECTNSSNAKELKKQINNEIISQQARKESRNKILLVAIFIIVVFVSLKITKCDRWKQNYYKNSEKVVKVPILSPFRIFKGHGSEDIKSVAFSPDSRYLLSAGDDHFARLWDLERGIEVKNFIGGSNDRAAMSATFNPDGRNILIGNYNVLTYVNLMNRKTLRRCVIRKGGVVSDLAFSPDGKTFLMGTSDGLVQLWDIKKWKEIRRLRDKFASVFDVAFGLGGKCALASCGDSRITIWDVQSGNTVRVLNTTTWIRYTLSFTSDGRYHILIDNRSKKISLIDLKTGKVGRSFNLSKKVSKVVISPNGRYVFITVRYSNPIILSLDTGKKIASLKSNATTFNAIAISPDSCYVAVGCENNGTIKIWKID